MSSSLQATEEKQSVADWGSGMVAGCIIDPTLCRGWHNELSIPIGWHI